MKPLPCLRYPCYIAVSCLLVYACTTIAVFDSITFQRTSLLKARTLVLMDHAGEPYEKYNDKIDSLMVEAQSIYAMEKARTKNVNSAEQWNQLVGTKTSILTGFFVLWKQKKILPEVFIEDAKPKVAAGFDEILKLEGAKLRH